jgi:hypothetical protein
MTGQVFHVFASSGISVGAGVSVGKTVLGAGIATVALGGGISVAASVGAGVEGDEQAESRQRRIKRNR